MAYKSVFGYKSVFNNDESSLSMSRLGLSYNPFEQGIQVPTAPKLSSLTKANLTAPSTNYATSGSTTATIGINLSDREQKQSLVTQMTNTQSLYDRLILTPSNFGISNTTPQFATAETPQPINDVGNLVREVGQGIARSLTSVSLSAIKNVAKIVAPDMVTSTHLRPDDFKSYFGQALAETILGKDYENKGIFSVKPVGQNITDTTLRIKTWQAETEKLLAVPNLTKPEKLVVSLLSNFSPEFTAGVGVIGNIALDLTGYGGVEKNVLKDMVRVGTEGDGIKLLLKLGVEEKLAKDMGIEVAKVSTEKEAKGLFESINKLQTTTKAVGEVKPSGEMLNKIKPQGQGALELVDAGYKDTNLLKQIERNTSQEQHAFIEKEGKDWSEERLVKEMNKEADLLAEENKLALEEYRVDAFGDIKNKPEFYGEDASQYKNFKEVSKKLYGSMKKMVENAEDLGSLEKLASKKNLGNELHNSVYSQEMTRDEKMAQFVDAIKKEYGYGSITSVSGRVPKSTQKIQGQAPAQLKTTPEITRKEGISATQDLSLLAKLNEVEKGKTYNKVIDDVAKIVKEPKPIARRFVDSLKEVKTKVLEYVQNTDERVRQLVSKPGVKIDDASNPYQKMTLYHGKVANKLETAKNEVESVLQDMAKLKINKQEVSDYLYFRHAPERNLVLGEGAAGITSQEAKAGLKALESSPNGAKIKELAERMQQLNNQTLDVLKDSGVISQELYSTLKAKYKNHVPLNRIFEDTENIEKALSTTGFDVRSTGLKKAVGSQKEVADIFTNITANYEQAVLRAEKNIIDQSTLAFVKQNKDILGDLFEIKKPQAIGKTFDGQMILERTQDPSILQMFENGKRVWLKINDPNLAIALRGVGKEKLGTLLNAVGKFTRLYSGLMTRFNPAFALPNKIRDLQETAVYLASQKDLGFKGALKTVVKDSVSVNDIISSLRGKKTEGARLYEEMKAMGGTTGGFGLSTRKQVELNLDKLEKLANSKTKQIGNNLVEYIDNWNMIFEDSTRLSVYKQALKEGLTKERAAFLAKEASINFNRMGKGGPIINALWMFSNASIQGSVKMLRSLKNPKVLGAVVATVGGAVGAVNEWNDRVDPDWRDKVSKWDRLNGLSIMLPSEKDKANYITIPVSWGLKPIKVMSDYAYDAIGGKGFDPKRMVNDTLSAIAEAYNPTGGTDLISALTPTILDTPVDIARNKSWSGYKLKPDYDPYAPEDIRYFSSLGKTKQGQAAISISEILNDKLHVSISPADIKYAYEQYVGGAGQTLTKAINAIAGAATGQVPSLDEFPLVSRFYKSKETNEIGYDTNQSQEVLDLLENQSRERDKIKKEAETLYQELKGLPKDEANRKANELKESNPQLYEKLKDTVETNTLNLNYNEKLMKQLGVENGERAKYIWETLKTFKTKEEKNAYVAELKDKKVISDQVMKQLVELKKNTPIKNETNYSAGEREPYFGPITKERRAEIMAKINRGAMLEIPNNPSPSQIKHNMKEILDKQETLKATPKATIWGYIKAAYDKIPFVKNKVIEERIKTEVKQEYPWSQGAIEEIDTTKVKDYSPIIDAAVGLVKVKAEDFPASYGGAYHGSEQVEVGQEIGRLWVGASYETKPWVENVDLLPQTTGHEMLHAMTYDENFDIGPQFREFNQAWNDTKQALDEELQQIEYEGSDNPTKEQLARYDKADTLLGEMMHIDNTLENSELYSIPKKELENPNNWQAFTERFSYYGADLKSMAAMHENLSPFYTAVFSK